MHVHFTYNFKVVSETRFVQLNLFQHLIPNAIHRHEGMNQWAAIDLVSQGDSVQPVLNGIDTMRLGIEPVISFTPCRRSIFDLPSLFQNNCYMCVWY